MAHKIDLEPVTDPLAFLDESLRSAFNLDENFKQIKKPRTEAKAAGTSIKNEAAGATPVPMSKIPSQNGTGGHRDGDVKMDEDDAWNHSNITLDQLRVAFGGDDWEDLIPSEERQHQINLQFYEDFRNTSESWRKVVAGPNGALTDTSTEKSKSPEIASDKEGSASAAVGAAGGDVQGKTKVEDESWKINLDGIEGLDLFDDMSPFETLGDKDIIMGENGSPFESVEKPQLTTEEIHFQALGGNIYQPETWTPDQKEMANFLFDGQLPPCLR
jgi:hypothetical protein